MYFTEEEKRQIISSAIYEYQKYGDNQKEELLKWFNNLALSAEIQVK